MIGIRSFPFLLGPSLFSGALAVSFRDGFLAGASQPFYRREDGNTDQLNKRVSETWENGWSFGAKNGSFTPQNFIWPRSDIPQKWLYVLGGGFKYCLCSSRIRTKKMNLDGGFKYFCGFIPNAWGNDPIWLICFRWVETTNFLYFKGVHVFQGPSYLGALQPLVFGNVWLFTAYEEPVYS